MVLMIEGLLQENDMLKKLGKMLFSNETRDWLILFTFIVLIRTFGFGLYQVPSGSMETTMLVGEYFFADKLTPLFKPLKRGDILSFNDPMYEYSKNPVLRIFQEYFWGPANWTKRIIGVPGDIVRGVIEDGKPVVYVNGVKLDEPYVNRYPLIDIVDGDVTAVIEEARREASSYAARRNIGIQELQEIFDSLISKHQLRVSYDPSVPFEKQPFYRMRDCQILRTRDDKLLLTLPDTPLVPAVHTPERHSGKSSWNGTDVYYIELDDHHYWVMGDNRLGSHDARTWGPLDSRFIRGRILFRLWSIDTREWFWLWDLVKHPLDFWSRVRFGRIAQCMH